MKEARLKWLHTVKFYLYNILQEAKLKAQKKINICQEMEMSERVDYSGAREVLGVLEMFYMLIVVIVILTLCVWQIS